MSKILVIGDDMDVVRLLQENLPDHEIVSTTEIESQNRVMLIEESLCTDGRFIEHSNFGNFNEVIRIHAQQFDIEPLTLKPNPATRYYHQYTQPYIANKARRRYC